MRDVLTTNPVKPNGRRERLGNLSNAGPSVVSSARKPDKAAPFDGHERIERDGHIFFLEFGPDGITVLTSQGIFINPWTKQPFQEEADAIRATRYRLKKGFWPGMKPKTFSS